MPSGRVCRLGTKAQHKDTETLFFRKFIYLTQHIWRQRSCKKKKTTWLKTIHKMFLPNVILVGKKYFMYSYILVPSRLCHPRYLGLRKHCFLRNSNSGWKTSNTPQHKNDTVWRRNWVCAHLCKSMVPFKNNWLSCDVDQSRGPGNQPKNPRWLGNLQRPFLPPKMSI